MGIKIVMPNKNSIGSLFRFKDHLPLNMLSSVVYKYSCAQCGSGTYAGSTTRALHMRIAEHRGRSFRTGKLVQSPKSYKLQFINKCNQLIRSNYGAKILATFMSINPHPPIHYTINVKARIPLVNLDL